MKKITILRVLLAVVFLLVFNILFYTVCGTENSVSVWVSYGLIHFSYILAIATPFLSKNDAVTTPVLGLSLKSISIIYLCVEFVVGIIFIFIGSNSYRLSLIVQSIILAVYLLTLFYNMIINKNTSDSVRRHEAENVYIKRNSLRVKMLLDKSSDKKVDKIIESVYDALHSSPTQSKTETKGYEVKIVEKISELENAVALKDLDSVKSISDTIITLIEKRNSALKCK